MALFKVNTGCREQEVCRLKWEWEQSLPHLKTSVFVIPGKLVKNREDRLIVLNTPARDAVNAARGEHPEYVFSFRGKQVNSMNNTAWKRARSSANLPLARIHDLKHTFGRRLRAAGVSFEDRQDLLGHRSGRITTHYSAAELSNLINAVEKITRDRSCSQTKLTLIREAV